MTNKLNNNILFEDIESEYGISFDIIINNIYNNNKTLFHSIEKVYIFMEWFIEIKYRIINHTKNNIPSMDKLFGKEDGYVGEGCYNIAFNYKGQFIVKIPKLDILYIENIQDIHNESKYYENAYGLFGEYDISKGYYELYNVYGEISDFVLNNLLILPHYVDLHLCFGIYDIGIDINILDKSDLVSSINNKSLNNLGNYAIFKELVLNIKEYEDIIDVLDYKIEHVLVVGDSIKYCDIDLNVLQGFCDYIKILEEKKKVII